MSDALLGRSGCDDRRPGEVYQQRPQQAVRALIGEAQRGLVPLRRTHPATLAHWRAAQDEHALERRRDP
jgi:hypothetical protein